MWQNYTKYIFSLQVLHGMEKHFREELAKKFNQHICKYNICLNFCVQKLSRYLHESIMIHLCIHVLSKFHCQNISNNKNSVFFLLIFMTHLLLIKYSYKYLVLVGVFCIFMKRWYTFKEFSLILIYLHEVWFSGGKIKWNWFHEKIQNTQ